MPSTLKVSLISDVSYYLVDRLPPQLEELTLQYTEKQPVPYESLRLPSCLTSLTFATSRLILNYYPTFTGDSFKILPACLRHLVHQVGFDRVQPEHWKDLPRGLERLQALRSTSHLPARHPLASEALPGLPPSLTELHITLIWRTSYRTPLKHTLPELRRLCLALEGPASLACFPRLMAGLPPNLTTCNVSMPPRSNIPLELDVAKLPAHLCSVVINGCCDLRTLSVPELPKHAPQGLGTPDPRVVARLAVVASQQSETRSTEKRRNKAIPRPQPLPQSNVPDN